MGSPRKAPPLSLRNRSPLSRRLLVVTGKGGTGKSTVALALGLLAARARVRTIVVELGGQRLAPELLGGTTEAGPGAQDGVTTLGEHLACTTIDPERALVDWLGAVGGGVPARLLASRASFRFFAAAAPGANELVTLVRLVELTRPQRGRAAPYDLAILDAPATGHALALLRAPAMFAAIARVGPVAAQAAAARELLEDPERSGYVAVAKPSEPAVTETLALAGALRDQLGRDLDRVVVNGVFARRFAKPDLDAVTALAEGRDSGALATAADAVRFDYERSRRQRNEIARLRRGGLPVLSLPFLLAQRIERAALERIADRLARSFAPGPGGLETARAAS